MGDRHWNFTSEGLVDAASLQAFWSRYQLTTQTQFLEIIYPFETADEVVLEDMRSGLAKLRDGRRYAGRQASTK